jgi:hypothetical protein
MSGAAEGSADLIVLEPSCPRELATLALTILAVPPPAPRRPGPAGFGAEVTPLDFAPDGTPAVLGTIGADFVAGRAAGWGGANAGAGAEMGEGGRFAMRSFITGDARAIVFASSDGADGADEADGR